MCAGAQYVVEQDCAANGREEVVIGARRFAFKGERVYQVHDEAELWAQLQRLVEQGELTADEVDAAIHFETVPEHRAWRIHNGRLGDLLKRGGAVAAAIHAHRTETTAPAALKAKAR